VLRKREGERDKKNREGGGRWRVIEAYLTCPFNPRILSSKYQMQRHN
jgi:hypothetical protein